MADFQLSTVSVRRCLKCDTDISHTHGVRKFCSEKCKEIFHGRQQEPVGNCQYCGKDISHLHGRKKYCSNVCLKKARTVRNGGTPRARLEPRTRPIVDGQRQCVKCDQWKPIEEFPKSKAASFGISQFCKRCHSDDSRVRMAEKYKNNPESQKLAALRWRQRIAEKEGREYKFRECMFLTVDQQYDRIIEKNARDAFDWWFAKKTDKQVAAWYEATGNPWLNPRLSDAEQYRLKYSLDKEFAINERLRRQINKAKNNDGVADLIRQALVKNGKSNTVEEILGYSVSDLRVHLERQFTKGMNWDKFSAGEIHIDHIHPKKSFDLSDPEQWKICWGLPNLQPLWAKDNLRKSARILRLL